MTKTNSVNNSAQSIISTCFSRFISKCHWIPMKSEQKMRLFRRRYSPFFVFIKKWLAHASHGAWSSMGLQKWTNSIWLKTKKNHAPLPNEAWKLHSTARATTCHFKMKLKRAAVLTRFPCNQFRVWTLTSHNGCKFLQFG